MNEELRRKTLARSGWILLSMTNQKRKSIEYVQCRYCKRVVTRPVSMRGVAMCSCDRHRARKKPLETIQKDEVVKVPSLKPLSDSERFSEKGMMILLWHLMAFFDSEEDRRSFVGSDLNLMILDAMGKNVEEYEKAMRGRSLQPHCPLLRD